jgi:hypothetical protein
MTLVIRFLSLLPSDCFDRDIVTLAVIVGGDRRQ